MPSLLLNGLEDRIAALEDAPHRAELPAALQRVRLELLDVIGRRLRQLGDDPAGYAGNGHDREAA